MASYIAMYVVIADFEPTHPLLAAIIFGAHIGALALFVRRATQVTSRLISIAYFNGYDEWLGANYLRDSVATSIARALEKAKDGGEWSRELMLASLDQAALDLEARRPSAWAISEDAKRAARRDAEVVAGKLRSLGVNAYNGGPMPFDEVTKQLRDLLPLASRGHWHAMAQAPVEPVGRAYGATSAKQKFTRAAVGLFPLLVVAVLTVVTDFEGTALSYVWLVASIWAGLTIISLFDPSYEKRVESLAKVGGLHKSEKQ